MVIEIVESVVSVAGALIGGVVVWALLASVAESVRAKRRGNPATARAQVALHGIRRQLDLVQLKSATRRDGIRLRRELHAELSELTDRRKPGV